MALSKSMLKSLKTIADVERQGRHPFVTFAYPGETVTFDYEPSDGLNGRSIAALHTRGMVQLRVTACLTVAGKKALADELRKNPGAHLKSVD